MKNLRNLTAKISNNRLKVSGVLIISGLLIVVFILLRQVSTLKTIERFHRIYYATQPYAHTYFLGLTSGQYPTDNWEMQEIITEVKPDFIIETGTGSGGTSLFYATILEKVNENGKVLTVNIAPGQPDPKVRKFRTWQERVEFFQDDSVSPKLIRILSHRVKGFKVLVTLDSDHTWEHVLKELIMYSPLISVGSYIVVQDTHLGGHPNHQRSEGPGGGPWVAVQAFLKRNKNFEVDHSREKYLVTQYPSGFLKRIQ
jgi:cephalosporin hydroxylase